MNTIIPNTFQHPNFYVDVLDEYLTPEESKILTHAIREILGWQDSLETRQKHIARDIFLNGRVVKGRKVYGGVNLCKEAIEKALDALHQFRILVKSGSPRDPRGQLYSLTGDVSQIDIEGLQARKHGKKSANKTRLSKSSSNKGHARLSHRPVNYSPVTQASSSPIAQASKPPVTQASSSPVTQAERNPEETHIEKPISSSSSKSSSSIEHAQKTEEEEGTDSFDRKDFSSPILTPEQLQKIQDFYLLGKEEVEGFLIRNDTNFQELCKCLDVIRDASESLGGVIYKDFSKRPIQRPLGFIFKNGWIVRGRACVPTLHAAEIKKDRNRWNNADVVESELEKTKRRIGIA